MAFNSLSQWLHWLEQLHPTRIDLGLERIHQVASRCDLLNPHFPLITVGGTNGKGSVCATLESIYNRAGYHVGLYTSPHLLVYNERVRIAGVNSTDSMLIEAFEFIEKKRADISLTYFEYSTLAAMYVLQRKNVDLGILEVGLGGRLDAVNLWLADIAVITSLGLDHTEWLGNTLDDIAFEKADIARAHKPLVVGEPQPPARLFQQVKAIGAELLLRGRDYHYRHIDTDYWTHCAGQTQYIGLPKPKLAGEVGYANSCTAMQVIHLLQAQCPVTIEQCRAGIAEVSLVGRCQHLRYRGVECIFDVAHNPQAVTALVDYLSCIQCKGKTLAVVGFMADKAIDEMLALLSGSFNQWFLGELSAARALIPAELATRISAHTQVDIQCYNRLDDAFKAAVDAADEHDRVVVFGSFITVADLLPLAV